MVFLFDCAKIQLKNRFKKHKPGNVCTVTIDTSDNKINEQVPFWSGWKSKNFKGAGVKYEMAVFIQSGDIVWLYGPFPCGAWHDKTVFRRNLKNRLLPNEKAEADVGYIGDCKCRIPQDYLSLEELRMKEEARGRHESANRLFKCFGILRKQFRGALNKHRNVCYACGVIIQLCLSEGTDSLFDLNYSI